MEHSGERFKPRQAVLGDFAREGWGELELPQEAELRGAEAVKNG